MAPLAVAHVNTMLDDLSFHQGQNALLINEAFVIHFKFWMDGQIRSGMRFRHDLFGFVAQFASDRRQSAFDLAWDLSQRGSQVVITTAASTYTVWYNLRTHPASTNLPILDEPTSALDEPLPLSPSEVEVASTASVEPLYDAKAKRCYF